MEVQGMSSKKRKSQLITTYSNTDLTSRQSSVMNLSTSTGYQQVTPPSSSPQALHIGPKTYLETTYPTLYQFVSRKQEWDAQLQLLTLTQKIINDKRVFRKTGDKGNIDDLKQAYRAWWMLVRSNPTLQDNNVRKLAKHIKDFLISAIEDASHTVRLSLMTSEKTSNIRSSTRENSFSGPSSTQRPDQNSIQKLSFQFPQSMSSYGQPITSVGEISQTSSTTHLTPKPDVKFESGRTSVLNKNLSQVSVPRPTPKFSQLGLFQESSADIMSPSKKRSLVEDDLCMQIIMKDILNDLTEREAAEHRKKMITISERMGGDDDTKQMKSSGTIPRVRMSVFQSKRISVIPSKMGFTYAPKLSTRTTATAPTKVNGKNGRVRHSVVGAGLRHLLAAPHLRTGLKEKMEGIRVRTEKHVYDRSLPDDIKGKSIKDKVHIKLRTHPESQMKDYIRPLGKK